MSNQAGDPPALVPDVRRAIARLTGELLPELVELRRDLHRHPEIARQEVRTTAVVRDRLARAGLDPQPFEGTGLMCDLGPTIEQAGWPRLAIRADLDALPIQDRTGTPWRSVKEGTSHACGHDVHTAAALGAGLVLNELHRLGQLRSPVRLIFQPAEEVQPSGAKELIEAGALESVNRIVALHCDPRYQVGSVAIKTGSITSAADLVTIYAYGEGGHTSRPQLTQDLVFAVGQLLIGLPAVLDRRLDPRAVVSLTWGAVRAGEIHNAIPSSAVIKGTLRAGDTRTWHQAAEVVKQTVPLLAEQYGIRAELQYRRGVPPVVNDPAVTGLMGAAARAVLGGNNVLVAEQSMGGEDFAWYLREVPGALMRLGVRQPGAQPADLHQPEFEPDEGAIRVGVEVLAATAASA
ncbi:MAG: amidohydrolase [Bifidobacteriaceae bacterium]|nr:amidohydrolase [Bifidobacteriaceae bacterium]